MSLRMLILAIVGAEPNTGYGITKEFDAVAGYFWRASHQQVYRELSTLAEQGLVRFKEVSQHGKPDKKIYAMTAKGRETFAAWFAEPQDTARLNDPLMVKLFAGEMGGIDALIEQIAIARERRLAALRALEAIERAHYSEDIKVMPRWKQLVYLTLRWGLIRERAWQQWAQEADGVLRG